MFSLNWFATFQDEFGRTACLRFVVFSFDPFVILPFKIKAGKGNVLVKNSVNRFFFM
jgi:hypothetical protein